LGNNLQTKLQTKTELTGGLAYSGVSGYAETEKPKLEAEDRVPDSDMTISKPASKEQNIEKAALRKATEDLKVGESNAETIALAAAERARYG